METITNLINRYGVFAWWIFMCLMMLASMTGCILGMSSSLLICCCGLFGSFVSLLIFAWQAYGEWLDTDQTDDQVTD
jgi:hypothetical protein